MDVAINWKKEGFNEMIRNLESLEKKMRNKVIRQTVREAGGEFVKSIKADAPVKTGLLKRNIKQKVRTRKSYIYSIFGAKWLGASGTTKGKNPAIYMHILEHGGKKRSSGTRPFAKRAFDRTRSKAISIVRRGLTQGLKSVK